jgi:hypothetical protein
MADGAGCWVYEPSIVNGTNSAERGRRTVPGELVAVEFSPVRKLPMLQTPRAFVVARLNGEDSVGLVRTAIPTEFVVGCFLDWLHENPPLSMCPAVFVLLDVDETGVVAENTGWILTES